MKEDKGLKLLEGKAIVQYVIDALRLSVEEVIIVSNNEEYKRFDCKVIPDIVSEAGPLGGILSGLSVSGTHSNFFVSCDMPFIFTDAIEYIKKFADTSDSVVPTYRGVIQPLFGIYSQSCIPRIMNSIQEKKLKLISFIEESNHRLVSMEDSGLNLNLLFTNINTQEDFAAAEVLINKS